MARTGMAVVSANYAAGDYAYAVGNYAAGGIFGSIGKALGGIARVAGAVLPGPIGTIARIGGGLLGGGRPSLPSPVGIAGLGPMLPEPGIAGTIHRVVPGGKTGFGYYNRKGEFIEGKRPVMNPLNVRALRRATRRVDGFARVARRALKHTPYMLVSRSSRRGGGSSRGVITRAEASRALRR